MPGRYGGLEPHKSRTNKYVLEKLLSRVGLADPLPGQKQNSYPWRLFSANVHALTPTSPHGSAASRCGEVSCGIDVGISWAALNLGQVEPAAAAGSDDVGIATTFLFTFRFQVASPRHWLLEGTCAVPL